MSESASRVETHIKEVEQAYRVLQEACSDARKMSKETGLAKAKERLSEGIRLAKSRLAEIDSNL